MVSESGNNRVAVVHGRNGVATDAIYVFLQALGLVPLEWGQVISELGSATPHTFEVVEQLFRQIQAVVVLLTPDETAYLRSSLEQEDDDLNDKGPAGQPRQNVLIEAGMAFGLHRTRTILVEVGNIRQASDLKGMNVVKVSHRTLRFALPDLAARLETAGCIVNRSGTRYLDTARFEEALKVCERQELDYPDLLFSPTDRPRTVAESIASVGLVDIENRGDQTNVLPPSTFYRRARFELAISGVTLARTFDAGMSLLRETLDRGVVMCLMVLDPNAPVISSVVNRERDRAIRADIEHVITLAADIRREYGKNFELRVMGAKPPFTAVMIDGDIRSVGLPAVDAEIRVQPASMFDTQHEGLVLAFKNQHRQPGEPRGVFEYFASDLRAQWKAAGQPAPN